MDTKELQTRYLRGAACLRDRLKTSSKYNHTNAGHAHAIRLAKEHLIGCQLLLKPQNPLPFLKNNIFNSTTFGPVLHNTAKYNTTISKTIQPLTKSNPINKCYGQKLVKHMARYQNIIKELEKKLKTFLEVRERI
eukprot:624193-Pyramimonas_sp.AAC.2